MNYNANPVFANLNIAIKPSIQLAYLFALIGLSAFYCVMICPIGWHFKVIASIAILLAVRLAFLQHALLLLPNSVVALYTNHQEQWFIKDREGNATKVRFHAESFVSAYLTVLICVKEEKSNKRMNQAILLFPSRLDSDDYRRLRVILRWRKVTSEA